MRKILRLKDNPIRMFVFQVSKVVGCRLEKQADLPFSFNDGACNTFLYPTPIVLLCFDSYYGKQACHK